MVSNMQMENINVTLQIKYILTLQDLSFWW